MVRKSLLALSLVLALASAASAQGIRRQGPADPRYYPDLYKGPGWGMTLSEYYTFGNKADGPYGYAIGGYRYGSNQDIQRWKQATGTEIPPGYYLQRWRDRRNERTGTAPIANPQRKQPGLARKAPAEAPPNSLVDDEQSGSAEEEMDEEEADQPTPAVPQSSRRNAGARDLSSANPTQSSVLAGPVQSASRIHSARKFNGIQATKPHSPDDKN